MSPNVARILRFDDAPQATPNIQLHGADHSPRAIVEAAALEEAGSPVSDSEPASDTEKPVLPGKLSPSRGEQRQQQWVDDRSCSALCQLILDDRRGESDVAASPKRRRRRLPPFLIADVVAPFLRFDMPQPNQLYAFGGRNQQNGPLDTVEMFDTWHGRWVACPSMPTRRAGSAAAVMPDGRIILVGGYNENGIAEGLLNSCDIYCPFTRRWQQAAPLARRRWGHGAVTLGSQVFVVGGCSLLPDSQPRENFMETLRCCEVYDPQSDRWSPAASLQVARSGSRVVALGSRYMAAVGGCDDVFGRAETQPTVELYDSYAGHWTLLDAQLAHPRTTAAIAAFDERSILVVGGAPSLSSAEVFSMPLPGDSIEEQQTQKDRSKQITDMPEGRMGCQAAVVNLPEPGSSYPLTPRKSVVIVGGERCDENSPGDSWPQVRQFASVPAYDIEKGEWRKDAAIPSMAFPRTAVALCVGMGHVMV